MNDFSKLYSQMCKLYEELEYKTLPKTDRAISAFKQAMKDNFGTSQKVLDKVKTDGMEEIYKDGKLIGYVGFSKYKGEPGDDFDYALGIGNFIILEKGQGLGTEVIQDIVEKYKKSYDLIYCFVDQNNKGAIRLYKRLGRVYDEEEPNERGEYYVVFYDRHNEFFEDLLLK